MPIFIKTEKFTKETQDLSPSRRKNYLAQHKRWIHLLKASGHNLCSGYLTNEQGNPGDGGFLVLEANSFSEAKQLVIQDPMILNNLVNWKLHEWIPVSGTLLDNH